MDFRILGPLEIADDGGPIALTGPKQRTLLAMLLIHRGEVVSVDRLMEALWDGRPVPSAEASLQNFVAQVRRIVGPSRLRTRPPGYVLELQPDDVLDSARFEALAAAARAAPAADRSRLLREALGIWRGPALCDFAFSDFAQAEIRRLEELRLQALEERIAADLELGQGDALVPELELLAAANPRRDRLLSQLMHALYRAGRQADALLVFERERQELAELGVAPGPELQAMHRKILRQEAELIPAREEAPDELEVVLRAFRSGRLVLVVGGEAGDGGSLDGVLAEHLRDRFACPAEYAGDLARVAEYVAVTHGVGPLYDELHEVHGLRREVRPVEQAVAALAAGAEAHDLPRPVIVSTSFDDAAERALEDAAVPFDLVTYVASGTHRGRFVHVPPGAAPRVIDVPNAYTALSGARTVVLKIHGCVGHPLAPEWETYAVSEDDHIDYLAQTDVAGVLPVSVAARLRRSHFLFLGYPVRHWSLRVFLHRVFGRDRLLYRSWAVAASVDAFERQLWSARGIETYAQPADRYATALADRVASGAS